MMIRTDSLISIIMPAFNSERYLRNAIESVLLQSYSNWELIIIDDCSTDRSIDCYDNYKSNPKIKVILLDRNYGAAYCRNLGINYANGDFICFLDSDDVWHIDKLRIQIDFMIRHNCDFCYTEYQFIDERNNYLRRFCVVPYRLSFNRMLFHCFTGCSTVMFDKSRIGKVQGLDVRTNNDYALFLEIMKHSQRALGIKQILAYYRLRNNSLSSIKLKTVKSHYVVLRKVGNVGPLEASMCVMTHNIIKYFYKERYCLFSPCNGLYQK